MTLIDDSPVRELLKTAEGRAQVRLLIDKRKRERIIEGRSGHKLMGEPTVYGQEEARIRAKQKEDTRIEGSRGGVCRGKTPAAGSDTEIYVELLKKHGGSREATFNECRVMDRFQKYTDRSLKANIHSTAWRYGIEKPLDPI